MSKRIYTEEEIKDLTTNGYINVYKELWVVIPKGSHVRYMKKNAGGKEPRGARFKPGGFVKNHYEKDGKPFIMLESAIGGNKDQPSYVSFPICLDNIESIWKKYDYHSFIEIHLIYNSLTQKRKQIEELNGRVERLENILKSLVKTQK